MKIAHYFIFSMPDIEPKVAKKYELKTLEAEKAIIDLLSGKISYRTAGQILGLSHSGIRGTIGGILRQWFQEGKIVFSKKK